MKQKLLKIVQVTVPIFFHFDEIKKIKQLRPKNIDFGQFYKSQQKMYVFGHTLFIFQISSK